MGGSPNDSLAACLLLPQPNFFTLYKLLTKSAGNGATGSARAALLIDAAAGG
jgi:hypothetical protein